MENFCDFGAFGGVFGVFLGCSGVALGLLGLGLWGAWGCFGLGLARRLGLGSGLKHKLGQKKFAKVSKTLIVLEVL